MVLILHSVYKYAAHPLMANRPVINTWNRHMEFTSLSWVRVMVFNSTFNNISVISWWSVLLVEETGVPRENHRPATSHLTIYIT